MQKRWYWYKVLELEDYLALSRCFAIFQRKVLSPSSEGESNANKHVFPSLVYSFTRKKVVHSSETSVTSAGLHGILTGKIVLSLIFNFFSSIKL
jgi:hypothetical protein